jgi:flagella basal body P-ring formation protein FlgA
VAGATAWQDAGSIRAAAEAAAKAEAGKTDGSVSVSAEALDSRLMLPACDQQLTASVPPAGQQTGRITAEVRCPGTRSWRLYVPVQVIVSRDILVAAVPLERGKVLAASDVVLAHRQVVAVPGGYLTTVEAAVGQVIRRSVPAGTVLGPAMLDSAVLIKRGQAVTIEARSGPIVVQMAGVAKGNGALGQVISVANTNSDKVVQGIVRNEKAVEILVP